jgi:hypothetical protein
MIFARNALLASVIAVSLLPMGVYADDFDDSVNVPVMPAPDCSTLSGVGYVDLVAPPIPSKGAEGYGRIVTTLLPSGITFTGDVTMNVLTFPKFHPDGSFSQKVRFDDVFPDGNGYTLVYDAKFYPTATPGYYLGKAKGTLAGGTGPNLGQLYFGETYAEVTFVGNRIQYTKGTGVYCGLVLH